MAPGLADIDWHAPWLAPWQPDGESVARRVLSGEAQADALNSVPAQPGATPLPVHFVPQSDLPAGVAYEQHIFETARVPTREGLHDFFNGLCWHRFPLTKRQLNQLHVAQIAQTGIAPVRGPARDGLTVFDENAAFLEAPDALWNALLAKDWERCFVALRPLWGEAHLVLFGHALLEKLVSPRKGITAHVYRSQTAINSIASMDAWVANDLSADKLAAKPFAHLPVLGVPGWWPANEDPLCYADASVFRAPKTSLEIA